MSDKFEELRRTTDNLVDDIDQQALKNFEMNLQLNNYKSELRHALHKVEEHTYCPGQVNINCIDKKDQQEFDIYALTPRKGEYQEKPAPQVKEVHGADCHCSKCCPNPNPNFLKKHKVGLLIGLIWIIMVFLAIGWTPTGGIADAINTSWVELLVNAFKIGIFAIAGIATYNLVKKPNE